MSIEDYHPLELTPEVLKDLCLEELGIEWSKMPKLLEDLNNLMLSIKSLEIDRFHNIYKISDKEDKMDCPYVRKCLIILMRDIDKWNQMLDTLKGISDERQLGR